MARRKVRRREQGAGAVRQLPSGRWQARYPSPTEVVEVRGPQGEARTRAKLVPAPHTFDTKLDAETWLDGEGWLEAPAAQRDDPTLRVYAGAWLGGRDLRPRTAEHYRSMLEHHILPELGDLPLSRLTPIVVRDWYGGLNRDAPTLRAHTYSLLRTILNTAVRDELIDANPCRVEGAGSVKRARDMRPATVEELAVMVEAMPDEYRLLLLLAAWCALRVGEVCALQRRDIDLERGVLTVQRAVVWTQGRMLEGEPKTAAGRRTVAIPPHLHDAVREHLEVYVAKAPSSLLFPGRDGSWLPPSTLRGMFYRARDAAGRPDLAFHALRHTGAVLAAQSGATLAELMARLGHTTPGAAMRYQHAAADRDRAIAEAMSALATSPPPKSRRRTASGT